MYKKTVLIGLSLLLLTGCWDSKAVDQVIYVSGLGIDYKDDQFVIYTRILQFENVGKQEGGGGQGETPVWGAQGVGKTFDSATDNLYYTTQEPISWAHIAEVVVTERALAKEGVIDEVFDVLNRYTETRSNVWLYATQEELPILAQGRPIMGTSPWYSRVKNPHPVFRQFSLIPPLSVREYLVEKHEPGQTIVVPTFNVNPDKWTRDNKPHPIHEFGGAAFIDKGKFKGSLTTEESKGIRWLQPKSERIPLYLYENEKDYASLVFASPKVKIEPKIKGEEVTVSIKVEVEGDIIEDPFNKKEKTLEKKAEEEIKRQILMTYKQALEKDIDVYELRHNVYRKDPQKFKALNLDSIEWLKEASLPEVQVETSIMSGGKLKVR